MSALADRIARERDAHGIALMPFLAGAYPTRAAFAEALRSVGELGGVGGVEIGFPFSDPVADGPVIQAAFAHALRAGTRVDDVFAAVAEAEPHAPPVAMASYSLVYRYGVERFCAKARDSKFAGVLVPDLPPPEAEAVCKLVRAAGLDTVLLVAPTTSAERRRRIADLCSGFVYYLSTAGVTGERTALPPELADGVADMKRLAAHVPVCVGFGVSTRAHVEQLRGIADGAIIGSALVRTMGEAPDPARAVAEQCRKLLGR